MGIIRSNAAFYLEARARGVDFSRTLTLGRQRLYLTPADLAALSSQYRPDLRDRLDDLRYGEPATDFLKRLLGVRDLQALDHSAYEGAAITHDLNAPLMMPTPAFLTGWYQRTVRCTLRNRCVFRRRSS